MANTSHNPDDWVAGNAPAMGSEHFLCWCEIRTLRARVRSLEQLADGQRVTIGNLVAELRAAGNVRFNDSGIEMRPAAPVCSSVMTRGT